VFQQFRQLGDIRRNAPRLIPGEKLRCPAAADLSLKVHVGKGVPVGVADDEAPPIQLVGFLDRPGRRAGLCHEGRIPRLGLQPLADVPGALITIGRPFLREAVVDDIVGLDAEGVLDDLGGVVGVAKRLGSLCTGLGVTWGLPGAGKSKFLARNNKT
jgi:hypothetical protein